MVKVEVARTVESQRTRASDPRWCLLGMTRMLHP